MTLQELRGMVGREVAVSEWLEITQQRIDTFADATEDHQWIHADQERAQRESPYETTIAHGFLTLSLLSKFMNDAIHIDGLRMGINYGLNRVRFPAAVRVGSRIRARFVLQSMRDVGDATEAIYSITVEGQRAEKPCCVAEWVVRYYA